MSLHFLGCEWENAHINGLGKTLGFCCISRYEGYMEKGKLFFNIWEKEVQLFYSTRLSRDTHFCPSNSVQEDKRKGIIETTWRNCNSHCTALSKNLVLIVSSVRQVFFRNCSNCRECFSLDWVQFWMQWRSVETCRQRGCVPAVLVLGMITWQFLLAMVRGRQWRRGETNIEQLGIKRAHSPPWLGLILALARKYGLNRTVH